MTTHSLDLRNRVVVCYNAGNISIRKLAERFMVNKKTVHQWLQRYREQGTVEPKQATSFRKSQLDAHRETVHAMVKEHPDYTLAEYCESCEEKTGVRLSESAMCRFLNNENLSRKKNFKGESSGDRSPAREALGVLGANPGG